MKLLNHFKSNTIKPPITGKSFIWSPLNRIKGYSLIKSITVPDLIADALRGPESCRKVEAEIYVHHLIKAKNYETNT